MVLLRCAWLCCVEISPQPTWGGWAWVFVGENSLRHSAHCRPTSRSNASKYRVSDFSTMELIDHPATPRTASALSMRCGGRVSAIFLRCALGLVRGLGIGPVFTGGIPFAERSPAAVLRRDVPHVFVRVVAVEMGSNATHSEVFATVGARPATTNKSWLDNRCQRWSRVCIHGVFPLASVPAHFAFIPRSKV